MLRFLVESGRNALARRNFSNRLEAVSADMR